MVLIEIGFGRDQLQELVDESRSGMMEVERMVMQKPLNV